MNQLGLHLLNKQYTREGVNKGGDEPYDESTIGLHIRTPCSDRDRACQHAIEQGPNVPCNSLGLRLNPNPQLALVLTIKQL